MEFGEISIKDKLGRTVMLRNARSEDSADPEKKICKLHFC